MLSYSAFSASVGQNRKSNTIGHLPVISPSFTNPATVKKSLKPYLYLAEHVGCGFSVITHEMATFKIAFTLQEQSTDELSNITL